MFDAIHAGDPDQKLLAYQYLQTLPKIAQGDSNKLWIVPSELGEALKGIGGMLGAGLDDDSEPATPPQAAHPAGDAGLTSRSRAATAVGGAGCLVGDCPASFSTRATYQSAWL